MLRSTIPLCALAALALSACSKKQAGEPVTEATTAVPVEATASATASAPADSGTGIPAAAQGRWALVPADCTSTAGDAKGLLIIDGMSLKFYESRAVLGAVKQRDANHIRASFAFAGEGQVWTQDVLLDVQGGGNKLVRRDYGPDAMPGALEYTRCGDTEAR
jgi:hypothetical protein